MSPPDALFTTRPALMHAALAFRSPELKMYDAIVALHARRGLRIALPPARTTFLALPPEVLALIRTHLVPRIAAHLAAHSAAARLRYESALRALLCPDCATYNDAVFGASVWLWPPLSGACACPTCPPSAPPPPSPAPPQFAAPTLWLQTHLSRPPAQPIADVVAGVLAELGCELRGGPARWQCPQKHGALAVVACAAPPRTPREDAWRRAVALRRVQRELGIGTGPGLAAAEAAGDAGLCGGGRRGVLVRRARPRGARGVGSLLSALAVALSTLAALPLVLVTYALAVVYCYCRPRALRIL